MKIKTNHIYQGDTLKVLKTFPDECIDMVITSPPYYGLRDCGGPEQIGLEKTFEEYLVKLLAVTGELMRVLKPEGTLWWNHGDSYGGSGKGRGSKTPAKNLSHEECPPKKTEGVAKSLMMQPYRLALRMIDEQGWILRNQIIWHKSNCMPASVKDRFTVDFEPLFFFSVVIGFKSSHFGTSWCVVEFCFISVTVGGVCTCCWFFLLFKIILSVFAEKK